MIENHFGMRLIFISLSVLISFGFQSKLYAYDAISVEKGGELSGTIKFSGTPPSNASRQVVNNADYCGSSVDEEKYLVGANHGLENAVVSIEGIQSGKAPLKSLRIIENKKCHFVPHVQVGMIGDSYEVRNSDPVLHNTHLHLEDVTLLNIAMPAGGKNIKKTISTAGIINIKCDAHKFMQGWLVVTDNPYSAVSDEAGRFRITDIPPGKYRVKFWHEGFPAKEKEVEIHPKQDTDISLDFK